MRKYKAPGVLANFIPSQNTVETAGQVRIIGLVGTGEKSFERKNVLVSRSAGSIMDQLPDKNIIEIYSVTSKPVLNTVDASNKLYTQYQLKNDAITWTPLPGAQYAPTISTTMGNGDADFLSNITTSIYDKDFIINETYKLEITYVDRDDIGTYKVSKMSTGEVIGEYSAGFENHTDIIPGISLQVSSTFILKPSTVNESKTRLGDFAYITTTAAKCHIDPTVTAVENTTSKDPYFIVTNGGSNFNIVGDGALVVSTPDNWPSIINHIKAIKNYAGVKVVLSIYQDGVLTNVNTIFNKFMLNVKPDGGTTTNALLFDANATTGSTSVIKNAYDITSLITATSAFNAGDSLDVGYSYILKNEANLDQTNIQLKLSVIDTTTPASATIADLINTVFIRNDVIPHHVEDQDSILLSLIKNLQVINKSNVVAATYKIKIKDISRNEISIFNVTAGTKIGTYSTDVNSEFREAIPGIGFSLFSFRDIEGLTQMYDTEDINDNTGATVIINTLAGIINPDVPQELDQFYVSYRYAKSLADYEPKIFYNYDDVVAEYGQYNVTSSGAIINSLTLGAEIAFLNGGVPIVCVQAQNDTDKEICTAIDKLAQKVDYLDNINAIIPLSTSKVVGKYLSTHVSLYSSSDYNLYRMGYLAATPTEPIDKLPTITDQMQGSIQTAQDYNNERIVYVVPGKVSKSIVDPITGYSSIKTLPGCYLAAAVAALAMKNDPAEPLTNKQIYGFNGLLTKFSEPEMNQLATAGCLVIKQEGSILKIRHGITTHGAIQTLADIQSNEITMIQIKDFVLLGISKVLGELYIGGKLKPTIIHDVTYTINQTANKYIADNIIIGLEGLTVKRSTEDPRQIDVKFLIEAVYPLNYIDINFGFSTSIQ